MIVRQPRRPTSADTGGWTALTPTLQKRIIENISRGAHIEVAARAAGIAKQQFYRWMEKGHDTVDPETGGTIKAAEPYRTFRTAVEEAEAKLEVDLVDRLMEVSQAAASGNASHLATFLGRRFRSRWSPRDAIEISGPDRGPVALQGVAEVDRLTGVLEALARTGKIAIPAARDGTAMVTSGDHPRSG